MPPLSICGASRRTCGRSCSTSLGLPPPSSGWRRVFGFASYFATYFGRFGPVPRDPVAALGAVMLMNALGPAYAWLTARYGAHHHHADAAHADAPAVKPVMARANAT